MKWIQNLLRGWQNEDRLSEMTEAQATEAVEDLRRRFDLFRELVEANNDMLATLGDMEEKAQGEFLFDHAYIRRSIEQIRQQVQIIIDRIIALGGPDYETLRARYEAILGQINTLLPWERMTHPGPYTQEFDRILRMHSPQVGGKNAVLGEMRSLGVKVPPGFAITAWSFDHFLRSNDLTQRIETALSQLDIQNQQDLIDASRELRGLILSSPLPKDLVSAIEETLALHVSDDDHVALRSSAVGEDTLYSFAGQYTSFLNVPRSQVLDRYREILASKYSPRAIYYFLSHSLAEAGLSMSVGCTRMIDAAVSGVMYTRDPLDPNSDTMHVHAVFGLGPYLVGGVITPDVVTLRAAPFEILSRDINAKPVQLVPDAHGGTREAAVPRDQQNSPCLSDEQLRELSAVATRLEHHFEAPQDIEFAYDRDGQLFILQARPLQTICSQPSFELPDMRGHLQLASGGTTVCPGAGCGRVVHVSGRDSLDEVREGDVVVAANPFPSLARVLDKMAALVTEVGSSASHVAALVREKRVPTLVGLTHARTRLPRGETVTVDATGTCVYAGCHRDLVQARRPEYDLFEDTAIFDLLRRLLKLISPLHLVHPGDPEFRPERCRTLHDITRFAHQRGIEEVFARARQVGTRKEFGSPLKTILPLPVHLLNLDDPEQPLKIRSYDDSNIPSAPMQAFWNGMLKEKWPFAHPDPTRHTVARDKNANLPAENQFTEMSFAVIRSEYMLANLRLGFHFTSVEAMLVDDANSNFIRVHYKGGGAADERRRRRIGLLEELLDRMGFEHTVKSDYIDCRATYMSREQTELNLERVGRLVILTKQLDMALSNERITRWYIEEFARKLDLDHDRVFPL